MDNIESILSDFKNGKMVILVDDEDRENEGDLILASDFVSPENINFMVKEARGLVCMTLTAQKARELRLPLMVGQSANNSPNQTAFTVSIEASSGISTGISASDRSHTIEVANKKGATEADIIMPGHIFPIRAEDGGVLKRAGHTEASVDLAKMSGLSPSAVICEIMNEDGTMARVPELKVFAEKHNLKIGTIADLISFRLENESFVEFVEEVSFSSPLLTGFSLKKFVNKMNNQMHYAFVKGTPSKDAVTTVRMHKQNSLQDVFGLNGGNDVIARAFKALQDCECGVFVYIGGQEGSKGRKDKDMEKRDYGVGAQILSSLGCGRLNLLNRKPSSKLIGLKGFGLEIVDSISLEKY